MNKLTTAVFNRQSSPAALFKAHEIKLLLDSLPESIPKMAALEDQFNMSRIHLQNAFRKLYGTTIGRYAKCIKLNQIKEYLKDHRQTMDSIAIHTGYNGGEALCRFFKKMEGVNPGTWRKNYHDGFSQHIAHSKK